jgi:carboxypeptidase Taq
MHFDSKSYQNLITELREIALLGSVQAVLGWDERTHLPPKGSTHRANQTALLAKLTHERFTLPRVGELIAAVEGSTELEAEPHSDVAVNVRETRRAYDRATKLPTALVEELRRTAVLGEHAWAEARKTSDFALFKPWLEKTLDLKRQEAACVAKPGQGAYDSLLDEFEPDALAVDIEKVFTGLRASLVDLVGRIGSSVRKAPAEILTCRFPAAQQEALALMAAKAIGYDFEAGRLDTSVHPFSTDLGPGDSRITTRYDEHWFGDGFFGTLHETGHALYTQGLPAKHFGTPRGQFVSLGIHESQSRLWENLVGRSRPFWRFFFPRVKEFFPDTLADVTEEQWHFAVNDIGPSLIRTEADEATYNLHVMLRFEVERALLSGDLPVSDLPTTWNAMMRDYFGITPPDDARGCLQDVHWAGGAVGYFPTYTLGNLYAAQFYEQARADIPGLEEGFTRGEFAPLLAWLRDNIHRHGKTYTAGELARRVTGQPLSSEPLLRHLRAKAQDLYGV